MCKKIINSFNPHLWGVRGVRLLLLLFIGTNYAFAIEPSRQFDFNHQYTIAVNLTESEYAPPMNVITIVVKDKTTGKPVYQFQDEGVPLDFFLKKMGNKKLFFYSIHSGGESGGSVTLRYLSLKSGKILNKTVAESPANFEFVNVDNVGSEEIVTRDVRFEWFEVEKDCHIINFYFWYFDTEQYFFPKIFSYQDNNFIDNTFKFKSYLQNHYLTPLENFLVKNDDDQNYIVGFIQYFYISAKLDLANPALTFIKKYNKPLKHYSCRDNKNITTTVFDYQNVSR